jgi:hypothetical protein
MASRTSKTRRTPNPPPTQAIIWPSDRFRGDRAPRFLRGAVRAAGRRLRFGSFEEGGRAPKAPAIDPAFAAILACAVVTREIGRPALEDDPGEPCWLELARGGGVDVLKIHYRGAVVADQRISRYYEGGDKSNSWRIVDADLSVGQQRLFSMDALRLAAAAARAALVEAGVGVSAYFDVRAVRGGGLATIGLKRAIVRAPAVGTMRV